MANEIENFKEFIELIEFVNIIYCATSVYNKLQKNKRRFWVRPLYLERDVSGFFAATFLKLKNSDHEQFRIATRMSPDIFDCLFTILKNKLEKNSARAIPADCRLFLTLIYLAHGTSRQYLSLTFKMSVTVVRRIVLETCEVIWNELSGIYLSLPNTYEWERIAEDFKNMWNLPNCVGAIDGKHVAITCPPHSGSNYYNYKGTYSIVLMGVCDANYTFTAVDIGAYGSQSDGGVLTHSDFGRLLRSENLNFPADTILPNSEVMFPYYLVGDAAFPLKSYIMRPYPGLLLCDEKQNFNKRLSRARRTIENAFGILTARWRILRGTLNMLPESAEKVVCATVLLHNYLKMHDATYCPPDFVDREKDGLVTEGLWRQETQPLEKGPKFSSNNSTRNAFQLRDILCEYLYKNKI
ncbi:protein ALP1-like [Lucilia sericata]|uniref:protein ALP1-like n=1 Tax=Lucilia sericata TaxID=13632 RepID=UPI0018A853A2|nr:protein ALP1-like [Lucilia sericata]